MTIPLPGQGGASWLPDPTGRFELRYWDGHEWTTAVQTGGQVLSDAEPLPEGEPGAARAAAATPPPIVGGPSYVPAAGPGDRYTSLAPDEAQRQLGQKLQMEGWTIAVPTRERFELTLTIPGHPNMVIGLLLALLWVLPGLIYFMRKSRATELRASLIFIPNGDGTRIAVQASSEAMQRLGGVMAMLPW